MLTSLLSMPGFLSPGVPSLYFIPVIVNPLICNVCMALAPYQILQPFAFHAFRICPILLLNMPCSRDLNLVPCSDPV